VPQRRRGTLARTRFDSIEDPETSPLQFNANRQLLSAVTAGLEVLFEEITVVTGEVIGQVPIDQ
jgi:hypothetical protein